MTQRQVWSALVLVIAMGAAREAAAKKVVVQVIALDHRLDRDAAVAHHHLRAAAQNDARVQFADVELDARGDTVSHRQGQLEQARILLNQSLDALDNMQEQVALEKLKQGIQLAMQANLAESSTTVLLDLLAARAVADFRLNKSAEGNRDLLAVLTIDASYKFDPERITPEVEKAIAASRLKVQNAKATSLKVESSPVPGEVWIDGLYRGVAPMEVTELKPGDHVVTVTAPGYDLFQERHAAGPGEASKAQLPVAVAGKQLLARIDALKAAWSSGAAPAAQALVELGQADEAVCMAVVDGTAGRELQGIRVGRDGKVISQGSAPLPDDAEPPPGAVEGLWQSMLAIEAPAVAITQPSTPTVRSSARPKAGNPWKYVAAGTAGLTLVSGLVLGTSAAGDASTARNTPQVDATAYQHAVNSGKSKALFADVCFGVAALSGGVAGYLFYRDTQAPKTVEEPKLSLGVAPTPGGLAAAVSGRF
ncbi:MAG: PEGA domain-containing protein [Deltaproteobacteria bacterium]|nr:PEGA domain-containing protein [Deltaproteobacteria bacterium]